MKRETKNKLMPFVDYLLVVLINFLGFFIFAWLFNLSWGPAAYSVLLCLILFGMIYGRTWNMAKVDRRDKSRKLSAMDGIRAVLPLVIVNLVIILLFTLIKYNILPIRDIFIRMSYDFPDNQLRVETPIVLFDYIYMVMRFLFCYLNGFTQGAINEWILLIGPAIMLGAGALGYFCGAKQFYISNVLVKVQEKTKEKFNE